MLVITRIGLPSSTLAAEDCMVNCTISCTNIIFTAFNPYDATFERANGSIMVRCVNSGNSTKHLDYYIGVVDGNSTNYSARMAKNSSDTIAYNIYINTNYTQILGDTSNGTTYISNSYELPGHSSRSDTYIVYGKIPVQPLAKPMTYTDNLKCGIFYNY